ncbi:unnamed protein product [Timema podura]|uniref:Uncharacterized protein n=1 Tax=Timema podura TaxID=61482 RepID=A0ABN7P075_TIMPD|nr:unnamed protein product [Timema podura]
MESQVLAILPRYGGATSFCSVIYMRHTRIYIAHIQEDAGLGGENISCPPFLTNISAAPIAVRNKLVPAPYICHCLFNIISQNGGRSVSKNHHVLLPVRVIRLSATYANGLGFGKVEYRGIQPTEIRTSISPFSEVELNTTSALTNYTTEAGMRKAICIGSVPAFVWREYGKIISIPNRDSNLDLPVISSLAYCSISALEHEAPKADQHLLSGGILSKE